jgi:hypothetical protein
MSDKFMKQAETEMVLKISGMNTQVKANKAGVLKKVYQIDVTASLKGEDSTYDIHAVLPVDAIPLKMSPKERMDVRAQIGMELAGDLIGRILDAEAERC